MANAMMASFGGGKTGKESMKSGDVEGWIVILYGRLKRVTENDKGPVRGGGCAEEGASGDARDVVDA